MCVYLCVCVFVCMDVCMFVWGYGWMYVCIYVDVCIYVCIILYCISMPELEKNIGVHPQGEMSRFTPHLRFAATYRVPCSLFLVSCTARRRFSSVLEKQLPGRVPYHLGFIILSGGFESQLPVLCSARCSLKQYCNIIIVDSFKRRGSGPNEGKNAFALQNSHPAAVKESLV